MPAVRAFALYAGLALLIDFIMQVMAFFYEFYVVQVTCFVALMSLDMERQRNHKFDIICCAQGKKGSSKPAEGVLYRY